MANNRESMDARTMASVADEMDRYIGALADIAARACENPRRARRYRTATCGSCSTCIARGGIGTGQRVARVA
jgi:hypothetical protein